jgi:hypothetical protein
VLHGNAALHINARVVDEPKMRRSLAFYLRKLVEGAVVNGHRFENQQLYVESARLHRFSIT